MLAITKSQFVHFTVWYNCFPRHQERLIEIKERRGKVFRNYSHPPIYDLDEIIQIRTAII